MLKIRLTQSLTQSIITAKCVCLSKLPFNWGHSISQRAEPWKPTQAPPWQWQSSLWLLPLPSRNWPGAWNSCFNHCLTTVRPKCSPSTTPGSLCTHFCRRFSSPPLSEQDGWHSESQVLSLGEVSSQCSHSLCCYMNHLQADVTPPQPLLKLFTFPLVCRMMIPFEGTL